RDRNVTGVQTCALPILHLGHSIPFLLCRYLQERFKCKIVIQVTDDEKYIWKDITVEQAVKYGEENVKDIIAFGLDPEKTFIFSKIGRASCRERGCEKSE